MLGLCPALEDTSRHGVRTQHGSAGGEGGTYHLRKNAEVEEHSLCGIFRLQSLIGVRVSKPACEYISA